MNMLKRGTLWMAALLALLALLALAALAPDAALAEEVTIDEAHFPDEKFRNYVLTEIDKDRNYSLSAEEIAAVKEIDVSNKDIKTLTGIKHFTALTSLYCYSNQLKTLDVSKNTKLTSLYCFDNNLTTLDVSVCTALETLDCSYNNLTELNVSENLNMLNCSSNNLTALDVSKNTNLTDLYCSSNQLTALDVSKNTQLTYLNCSNQTRELEVKRAGAGNWSVNLSEKIGAGVTSVNLSGSHEDSQVAKVEATTVSWNRGKVKVSYEYNIGYKGSGQGKVTMDVTLTLIPLNARTDTSVSTVTVDGTERSITIDGENITVKLPSGTGLPTDASQITITPTDPAAVASTPIKDTGDESGKTWTFTVTAEDGQTTRTYTLCVLPAYTVTVTSGGHGTASASPELACKGELVTLTATPNPGYFFDHWEVTPDSVTINEDNTFTMPAEPVTITAHFKLATYTVTLNPNGGTINSGNVTTYTYGEGATLPTDVTLDGYTFAGWYANEDLTDGPVTAISATDMGDKAYWAKWTQDAPPYVPPTPVAPPEIDFTPGGDQPGGDEPGGDQPASVELEPGQSATLDLGVVDNYAAFAAAGVEIVATPVCDAGMTASAAIDQSGRILLNLYAIEPGEHQVSVTLSAAGCQPVTVAQITLTVPGAQPEGPEDPDAPDLPDIQPQEGTQAYTGVQGVTHLSLSQGTVVFTLPDLAGTEGVVWKSSKPKVVSIDPQTGEAQLKKSGTATLTATLPDGTTITQKVNVHKKDFAQPDTIRLQTKVDGKWTDVPEEGIVVVPKKSGQKSVPTRLVGDGGEIIIESIEADKALLTRSSGNPAPVKIKKRSLTDGQTTTLVIRANGQEFTLPITIDSTAKDLYPSEIQSILQQEE